MKAERSSAILGSYYFGLILLLYLPIALLFLFSVNSSASLSFPIKQLCRDGAWDNGHHPPVAL
jgi:ABC-type spermidine/putrescine transport system permease subunit II